jgi:Cu-processing system permease protein
VSGAMKVLRFQLRDLLRGRWLIAYAVLFALAAEGLLRLGGGDARALLGIGNLVLFVVPLISLVFGTAHLYDLREFTELLLSQPVNRGQLFAGLYGGIAVGLSAAFLVGTSAPFLARGLDGVDPAALAALLGAGVMLTLVFEALAFLIALATRDKARGLAVAIAVWLALTVLYDGAVLAVAGTFAAYPLERPMIGLMLLNPVDLARVLVLMQLDIAALMGYTGAVFERFFGSDLGLAVILATMAAWVAGPVWLGVRAFRRQDF